MIACRTCGAAHPFGVFVVGERVVLAAMTPQTGELPPGTKFKVTAYTIVAGKRHQEIHVKRKNLQTVLAPCQLMADAPTPSSSPFHDFKTMSREEFRAKLLERRAVVRVLTHPADRRVG